MFERLQYFTDKYYQFWVWFGNFKERAKILPVDFHKHWIHIIWLQKRLLGFALLCQALVQTFYALYPLFIGWIIESQQFSHFATLMLIWLLVIAIDYFSQYFSALLEIQCIGSIQYNAFQFFLTVDPVYHAMKASGKLFAKIERCSRSYEDFLDIILWDILPIVVSVIAVVGTFLVTHPTLGLMAFFLLVIMAIINTFLNLFTSNAFEKRLIEADDTVKIISVESLTQVQLIRSSFATGEIAHLGHSRQKELQTKEGSAWLAFAAAISISRLFYLLSIFVLGKLILSYITQGYVTVLTGTTLLLTYINGTYEIIQVGRRLRKLVKSITRIKDLYSFMPAFGKQTFPVLKGGIKPTVADETAIILEAQNLSFDYNPRAQIFAKHNLYLKVPQNQPNKLYGIIGPSGMGKTTLLSILGGQLHPDRGTILVNGIPMYKVDDKVRRSIIVMQCQIVSNLSGSVRRNLLLVLPFHKKIYSDDDIINILEKVGIWKIFEEKEGLATPVGEAGLTLSGGQRQRLNFAALYLRATYYKPPLILIDEPTSSLDEVSERAITGMISHLAEDSLTLVIAHRLKTLHDAVGILDFSLLDGEKDINFYSRTELEKKSIYYKKLMQGDITIEA